MLGYYVFLAWKSIRRTPGNSLIVLAGITLGVTIATAFSAVYHAFARDPIPNKSGSLHYVRMDNGDPRQAHFAGIPPVITYQDMEAMMKSPIPVRQTGSFPTWLRIATSSHPEQTRADYARVCHGDFFSMFEMPFQYGSAWSHETDEKAERVVVIDDWLNQRMFGGTNSVGQRVFIEENEFRIVGVLGPLPSSLRYYDLVHMSTAQIERIYVPMSQVRPMQIQTNGMASNWKPDSAKGFEASLRGELIFIQMWVELPGVDELTAYKNFLDGYTLEQRRYGRFQRPLDNRVTPYREFAKERQWPPPEATAVMITANLFLVACAMSLSGLMLTRFLARAKEAGIRRALGASPRDIFIQYLIEAEVIAFGGAILGSVLAAFALAVVSAWYRPVVALSREQLFPMDWPMVQFAALAALIAGFLACAYPVYRVCRLAPTSHLKIQ